MKNTTRRIPIIITTVFSALLIGVFVYRQLNSEVISLTDTQDTNAHMSTEDLTSIQDGKLNINRATVSELTLLPGIGETLAKRIVDYREENGPFNHLDELMNVSGIGKVRYAAIADYITLGQ